MYKRFCKRCRELFEAELKGSRVCAKCIKVPIRKGVKNNQAHQIKLINLQTEFLKLKREGIDIL